MVLFMIDTVSLATGERGRKPVHLSDNSDRIGDGVALHPEVLREVINELDDPDDDPYPGYYAGPVDVLEGAFTFDGEVPF